ncbi:MAG: hypothetical protein J6P03_03175 [Opitutales bacterium]|nr:hypothetical protein [Opitutales bacterium]
MKRLISYFVSLLVFIGAACAQGNPAVVLKAKSFKDLSQKIIQAKNPGLNLFAAMAFGQCGYPSFDGVDPSAPVIAAVWRGEGKKTCSISAVKASENSQLSALMKAKAEAGSGVKFEALDGWLVSISNKLGDSCEAAAREWLKQNMGAAPSADIVLSLDIPAILSEISSRRELTSPQAQAMGVIKANVERCELAINIEGEFLNVDFSAYLFDGSVKNLLASFGRAEEVEAAKFLPADAPMYMVSSMVNGEGTFGAFMAVLKDSLSPRMYARALANSDLIASSCRAGAGAGATAIYPGRTLSVAKNLMTLAEQKALIKKAMSFMKSQSELCVAGKPALFGAPLNGVCESGEPALKEEKVGGFDALAAPGLCMVFVNGYCVSASTAESAADTARAVSENKPLESHLPASCGGNDGVFVISKNFAGSFAPGSGADLGGDVSFCFNRFQNGVKLSASLSINDLAQKAMLAIAKLNEARAGAAQ